MHKIYYLPVISCRDMKVRYTKNLSNVLGMPATFCAKKLLFLPVAFYMPANAMLSMLECEILAPI